MTNSEPDQFLARFVFNQFFAFGADEFITDVTLAVDGLLISGRPISSKRFFDRLGAGLPEAIGSQVQALFSPPSPGVSKDPSSSSTRPQSDQGTRFRSLAPRKRDDPRRRLAAGQRWSMERPPCRHQRLDVWSLWTIRAGNIRCLPADLMRRLS